MVKNVPERGDIVWVHGNKGAGHEQLGTRPALVVTEHFYNKKTGCAIICFLTRKKKGYATEVPCRVDGEDSVILVDQMRLIDFRERKVTFITALEKEILQEVGEKMKVLLSL